MIDTAENNFRYLQGRFDVFQAHGTFYQIQQLTLRYRLLNWFRVGQHLMNCYVLQILLQVVKERIPVASFYSAYYRLAPQH